MLSKVQAPNLFWILKIQLSLEGEDFFQLFFSSVLKTCIDRGFKIKKKKKTYSNTHRGYSTSSILILMVEDHAGLQSTFLSWGFTNHFFLYTSELVTFLPIPVKLSCGADWGERVRGTPDTVSIPAYPTWGLRAEIYFRAGLHSFVLWILPNLQPCLQQEKESSLPFPAPISLT